MDTLSYITNFSFSFNINGNTVTLGISSIIIIIGFFIVAIAGINAKKHANDEPDDDYAAPIRESRERRQKAAKAEKKADKSDGKKGKKRSMKSIESTQAFSPVLDIRDGIIITKDGRYFKILEFSPINFELRSPFERDGIVEQFSNVIRTWPRNVHLKIISAKSDVTPFIEDLNRCKQRELDNGNTGCAGLIDDQIDLISRISSTQGVRRRFFVSFEYEQPGGFKKTPRFEDVVAAMNREARSIANGMEACGNNLISNDSREYLLEVLYITMCKFQSEHYDFKERAQDILSKYRDANQGIPVPLENIPVADFFAPSTIDSSLSSNYIMVDRQYVTHAYLPSNAYPVQACGGWLQVLFNYMDDVDVDFWVKKENSEAIARKLQYNLKTNKIRQKQTEDISQDYEDILDAIESGYYIKRELANGNEFCYISTIITISAEDQESLNAKYSEFRNHCVRNDMTLRKLTFQQETAYKCCIPYAPLDDGIFSKTKRNVMALDLGSCYPFTAYELNDKNGVFLGVNATYDSPCFLNIFDTSVYANGNTTVLGSSGSGKTYTLLTFLLRMRERGLQTFVIAPLKAHEFYRACKAIGGEFIRIAPGSNQTINIMEIRKKDMSTSAIIDGSEEATSGSILTDKINQMERFFDLLIKDMTVTERQTLDDALMKTYEKFGITTNNKSLIDRNSPDGAYKEMPLLGDLHKTLESFGEDAKRLRSVLSRFVTGSAKNFNAHTNVDLTNKFIVIDVSTLTEEMLPIGMFISLDVCYDKIKQDRTTRKIIAVDECWKLMKASEVSAKFCVEVVKTCRGYATSCIFATQDLDDILNNESGAAIINNTKIKILLPSTKNEMEAIANCVDITSSEKERLQRAGLKLGVKGGRREALLIANSNHVFVRVEASRKEHDLITTNAEDLARIYKSLSENKKPD